MAQITTNLTGITDYPKLGDSHSVFRQKADTAWNDLAALAPQINQWATEANAVRDEVNNFQQVAVAAKETAEQSANIAVSAVNNKGEWSNLTGSLNVPAAVNHQGFVWVLNRNLSDVTTSEPSDTNSDWTKIGGRLFDYKTISSDYTAKPQDYLYCDTSGGSITVTLPANPIANDRIGFLDASGTFDTNSLIVVRNGNTIMGLAEDMTVDTKNISFELIYNGSDWRIK